MKAMFERIEDRPVNYIEIVIITESGCDPRRGEYSASISSFIGGLDISSIGGVDDVSLIKECIENDLDFSKLPEEGSTVIVMEETGEWESVFWHKYYKIIRVNYLHA